MRLSLSVDVRPDTPLPEYSIGEKCVYENRLATVVGLIYCEIAGTHPYWDCLIKFDDGECIPVLDRDLSHPYELEESDRCEHHENH